MNLAVTCNTVPALIEALTKFGNDLALEKAVTVITTDANVTLSVSRRRKAKSVKKSEKSERPALAAVTSEAA